MPMTEEMRHLAANDCPRCQLRMKCHWNIGHKNHRETDRQPVYSVSGQPCDDGLWKMDKWNKKHPDYVGWGAHHKYHPDFNVEGFINEIEADNMKLNYEKDALQVKYDMEKHASDALQYENDKLKHEIDKLLVGEVVIAHQYLGDVD
jgi:hypothetical protein